jgi:dienelactone hydrolase
MKQLIGIFATGMMFLVSCNNEGSITAESNHDSTNKTAHTPAIKEQAVDINAGGTVLKSFVAYDSATTERRPIVLVVPEWWGMTEYPKMRARQLAELGYLAVAVDMYGDGKIAEGPETAMKFATPFYQNPQIAKARLEAAAAQAKMMAVADTSKIAAIGYCFGGSMVINAANLGSDFDGVVSFHGGLEVAPPNKEVIKAKYLIAHGEADGMVPPAQVAAFKKAMDSVGANYDFKSYPNATHAFTNPEATEKGAKFKLPIQYNGAADTASWNDMKAFFGTIFK